MDIESECFPCIPMSSAIQLSTASLLASQPTSGLCPSFASKTLSGGASDRESGTSASQLLNAQLAALNGSSGSVARNKNRRVKSSTADKQRLADLSGFLSAVPVRSSSSTATSSTALLANLRQGTVVTSTSSASTPAGSVAASHLNLHSTARMPPTPPTSNSDSDGETGSAGCASITIDSLDQHLEHAGNRTKKARGLTTNGSSGLMCASGSSRASLASMSSLISVQPKNAASGTAVVLTEEEKRTLIAEGKHSFSFCCKNDSILEHSV